MIIFVGETKFMGKSFSQIYSRVGLLILFLSLLFASNGNAVTTNTTNSGNWNTGGNWDNGVPGGTDDANVNHAMTVNVNISSTRGDFNLNYPVIDPAGGGAFNLSVSGTGGNEGFIIVDSIATFEGTCNVNSNGTLIVRSGDTLTVGATTFANGSTVLIESGGVMIINGNLTNNNNSTGITVNGNLFVNGNVTGGNGSSITGAGGINATGTITTSGSGTIFGSSQNCTTPPCSAGPGAVPVVLSFFKAEKMENGVLITWETESEQENSYFTLERSIDGKDFQRLADIDGSGTSSETSRYSFTDSDHLFGLIYYRLWQVDYSGEISYLSVSQGLFIPNIGIEINLYPNPVLGNFVNLSSNALDNVKNVSLAYVSGKVIMNRPYNGEAIQLPKGLEEGLYIVGLTLKSGIAIRKLLILAK